MISAENLKTLAIILLASFLFLGYISDDKDKTEPPVKKNDNFEVTENIKLYSNGKLIGQWEGIGRGRMSGNTYSFKTDRGSFSNEIRISGDFVIETDLN